MHYRSLQTSNVTYSPFDFTPTFPVIFSSNAPACQPENLHFHNCIEVARCLSGSGCLVLGPDAAFPFRTGDFCLILSQVPHAVITDSDDARTERLYIEPRLLQNTAPGSDQLWQALHLPQSLPCIIGEDLFPALFYYLSQIFEEMRNQNPLFQKAAHGLLLSMMTELGRFSQTNAQSARDMSNASDASDSLKHLSGASSTVIAALTYIYSHYNESVSVNLIADHCGVSVSHLRRLFSAVVGVSPLEFIQRYRIQQACHLIRSGQLPIKQIASQTGYVNLSSFNRQFRQYMHMSPSKWKNTSS